MDQFYVYGNYGYVSECELYSHKSREFAVRWAEGYTRNGLGGYDFIEVGYFNEDKEYIVVWFRDADDPELEGDLLYEDDGA